MLEDDQVFATSLDHDVEMLSPPALPCDIAQEKHDALQVPILQSYPKTVFGKQNRAFSTGLYDKYQFIEYSVEQDAIFCFPCRFFGGKTGHAQETTFTVHGFRNWKKCERIDDHAKCKYHKDSVVAHTAYESSLSQGTVLQQQVSYYSQLVLENRAYVKSLARIAVFCGRQNLAMRGHSEVSSSDNKGNFLELVDLVADESHEFRARRQAVSANANYN
jgi:hypothetical protein